MEHQPGDIIHERYEIISFIGRGAFGETYLVKDIRSPGLTCLLKYLKPLINTPSVLSIAKEKFRQEANILRRLGSHNQIPQLYDYFEENQRFYLVQEYIEGSDLEDIRKTQLFSEREVIRVLQDVLSVLDYLSNCNVIHRDIKPANLVRRNDGRIFVVDFGAVKEVSTLSVNAQGQTISTVAIGTPYYMPREQNDGKPIFASDIYALGITGFILLTGVIPPEKNHQDEIIWNGVQISSHLAIILNKMVRLEWTQRYQRAADVLADLELFTLISETLNSRYQIKRYLGGEFSHTYLVEDLQRSYEPNYIIKQLKLRTNNQQILQEAQNRFRTVVQAVEQLPPHPQIPKLKDHFQKNQEFYLVYEYIEGEPLSTRMTPGDRLSEPDVIIILKDVLEVLSFIHQQNIIHGDIKPSNLIKPDLNKKIVLIDFAQFKQVVTLEANARGIVVKPGGTDGYMPLEQLQNRLQPSSDIYALGMTAIQALTGISTDQLEIDSHGEVKWQNQAQVSPKLARILTKMVRSQCRQRYQSAQEVLNDINASSWWEIIGRYRRILAIFSVGSGILIALLIYNLYKFKRVEALIEQGKNLTEKRKFDQAIKIFTEAIDIDDRYTEPRLNRAYVYRQNNQHIKELLDCQTATIINDKFAGAWQCLGEAAKALKQYEESIPFYEKAINLTCNSSVTHDVRECAYALNNKGESLLKLPKFDEAIEVFDKAIAKDIDSHIPWTNKGKALLQKGSTGEALKAFEEALRINQNYQPAIKGKQEALEKEGLERR